uniref:Putative secreted protein n=1 Tax=Ixodes scapularis TaxID=6945 RepID=A0A4D5RZD8_IXOSC
MARRRRNRVPSVFFFFFFCCARRYSHGIVESHATAVGSKIASQLRRRRFFHLPPRSPGHFFFIFPFNFSRA